MDFRPVTSCGLTIYSRILSTNWWAKFLWCTINSSKEKSHILRVSEYENGKMLVPFQVRRFKYILLHTFLHSNKGNLAIQILVSNVLCVEGWGDRDPWWKRRTSHSGKGMWVQGSLMHHLLCTTQFWIKCMCIRCFHIMCISFMYKIKMLSKHGFAGQGYVPFKATLVLSSGVDEKQF